MPQRYASIAAGCGAGDSPREGAWNPVDPSGTYPQGIAHWCVAGVWQLLQSPSAVVEDSDYWPEMLCVRLIFMFSAMRCSSIAYRSSINEAGIAGRPSSDPTKLRP